jgi:hypothetical protein
VEEHVREVSVEVSEVGAHEQRREFTLPDGQKALTGRTLREWLDQLGGPRGQIDSPAGKVDVECQSTPKTCDQPAGRAAHAHSL